MRPKRQQMRCEDLLDKGLFSLPLNENDDACQPLVPTGPATKLVLFPQLAKAIVFQPDMQVIGGEPPQLSGIVNSICDQHVLRSEMIQEQGRLS